MELLTQLIDSGEKGVCIAFADTCHRMSDKLNHRCKPLMTACGTITTLADRTIGAITDDYVCDHLLSAVMF